MQVGDTRTPSGRNSLLALLAGLLLASPTLASASGGWIDRAPIPRPRLFHFSGVGSDGRIYVAAGKVEPPRGGTVPGVGDRALDIYDPKSNTWEQGPAAPRYRGLSREYVVRYDPDDRSKILREGYEEGTQHGELQWEYVPGTSGRDGRLYWFTSLGPIYFDPKLGAWSQGEPVIYDRDNDVYIPPVAKWFRRTGATVASEDGKLYLVGGTGYLTDSDPLDPERYGMLSSVETYDPATRAWEERAPMKQPRQIFAACFGADGKLYVFGGFGGMGFWSQRKGETDAQFRARDAREMKLARAALRSVEAYDPETNTWTPRAPMPAGRQSMGAALGADGRIYVVGGADQYSRPAPKAEVFVYDPKTDSWSEGPPLSHPRYHHTVVATPDGRIWAIGGTNGTRRRGALPRGEPEGLVRPIEVLDTNPAARPGVVEAR